MEVGIRRKRERAKGWTAHALCCLQHEETEKFPRTSNWHPFMGNAPMTHRNHQLGLCGLVYQPPVVACLLLARRPSSRRVAKSDNVPVGHAVSRQQRQHPTPESLKGYEGTPSKARFFICRSQRREGLAVCLELFER
jgi:hypothetical protein